MSPEGKIRLDQYAKKAVDLAMQGRWEEAITANRSIIQLSPQDVEAHNRLGKALMEVGEHASAREAYGRALELDRYNNIAKKNLKRLSRMGEVVPKDDHHKVVADVFVEEQSKARVVNLVNLGPKELIAQKAPGEEVSLQAEGQGLVVRDGHNQYLGEVEPRYGLRLAKLIRGGNRYTAAISRLGDNLGENEVRILVREVYQSPSQAGRLSFPLEKKERFRPYVKESLLRSRLEDDSAEETDELRELPEIEGFAEPE